MRVVMSTLLHLTAFAVGCLVLAGFVYPTISDQVVVFLRQPNGSLVSGGISLIFVICPLAILLRWWRVSRRAREISYTTENGKISVSLIAIEEALTRAIEGEAEVKKATVRVFEDRIKRSIVIEAVVSLWEVANVTERNRFCQRLLRRRFAELMPEQTAVQVVFTVHRLTQRRVEVRPTRSVPANAVSEQGLTAGAQTTQDGQGSGRNVVPFIPTTPPNAVYATSDEDLYVGPTYPVVRDDEDESGSSPGYFSHAQPTSSKGAVSKKR
jgi:hypothetical protein